MQNNTRNIIVNADISKSYKRLCHKNRYVLIILAVVTLVLVVINLLTGTSGLGGLDVAALFSGDATNPATKQAMLVLTNLRLPHTLCSVLCGLSLAVCGCILQSTLNNPLASPSTIGISQGAACGACIAIICVGGLLAAGQTGQAGQVAQTAETSQALQSAFNYQTIATVLLAFAFALIPTGIIYALSKFKNISVTGIVLTGVTLSIFFSGIIALVEYFADSSKVAEVVFWTFGSVRNASYTALIIMGTVTLFTLIYAMVNTKNYNAMECGDMTAHSVGLNVASSRLRHLIVAALSAGCITAFCGTINFVGLISPHIMRRLVSANYRYLMPASAMCGVCIVTLSDILSAIILPGVILPIGAITSIIGAPIFVYVLVKKVR